MRGLGPHPRRRRDPVPAVTVITRVTTAGSIALTGKSCAPTSFHWMWDTYSNSYGLVTALAKKKLDTWYFITADCFSWNYDAASRAFAQKFFERHKAMPTMGQAGAYSAVRHYLRAVDAAKTLDAAKVAEKMREMPVSDAVIRNGRIRPDGRLVHDMYLVEVRRPGDASDPWDLEKVQDTLNGDEVFRPLSESDCPLVRR